MNPTQKNLDSDNLFDRLPDEIVLSVFDKLHDAKSLCLSLSVCKRFYSIIHQVEEVFLHIPRRKSLVKDSETHKNFFKNHFVEALMKPFCFISQMVKFKSKEEDNDYSYHVPNEILKHFEEIRALNLRLPCQEKGSKTKTGKEFNSMLKWKAEFGSQLNSCVMLGAKSSIDKRAKEEHLRENDENSSEPEVIADVELKLRIVWMISCLIVASARHYLIQEIVKEHKLIEKIVVTDESDQGKLCMGKEQIEELRQLNSKESLLENRTKLPALRMKMWYLEKLELLDSGRTMEGATLVVIRAAGGGGEAVESDSDLVADAFEGVGEDRVVEEAVRKLMTTKKCYILEMNAF